MQIRKTQKKIEEKGFDFKIKAYELFALTCIYY